MGIKSKLKHTISFLLHGEAKPIYASIHYLAPNEHLKGKKIVITVEVEAWDLLWQRNSYLKELRS